MKAGAVDFLAKVFREQDLLDAIVVGLDRDAAARRRCSDCESTRRALESLTGRERQVMEGLLGGHLKRQVAAGLGVSEVIVKLRRRRLMKTTSVALLLEAGTQDGSDPLKDGAQRRALQ